MIDPWDEDFKILVFEKASTQEFVPQITVLGKIVLDQFPEKWKLSFNYFLFHSLIVDFIANLSARWRIVFNSIFLKVYSYWDLLIRSGLDIQANKKGKIVLRQFFSIWNHWFFIWAQTMSTSTTLKYAAISTSKQAWNQSSCIWIGISGKIISPFLKINFQCLKFAVNFCHNHLLYWNSNRNWNSKNKKER